MKNMNLNKMKTFNLTTSLIIGLLCGGSHTNAAVPIKLEVGGSSYYQAMPCIAKVGFKYHNDDVTPLITSAIKDEPAEAAFEIAKEASQEENLIEHADVYILRVGENKNVDAITNSIRVPINTMPKDLKGLRVWFEKDAQGQQRLIRAKVELKDDQTKPHLKDGEIK